jgi:hypothetical protein
MTASLNAAGSSDAVRVAGDLVRLTLVYAKAEV